MAKERVIPRSDTNGRWANTNPQLAKGEIVFTLDEHNRPAAMKIGQGVDGAAPEPNYNDLPFALGAYPRTLQNGVLVYPYEPGEYGAGYLLVSHGGKFFTLFDEVQRPFTSSDLDDELAQGGIWKPVGGGGGDAKHGQNVSLAVGDLYYFAGAVLQCINSPVTLDTTLSSILSHFANLQIVSGLLYAGVFQQGYRVFNTIGEGLVYYSPTDNKHYTGRRYSAYYEWNSYDFEYNKDYYFYEVPGFVSPDSVAAVTSVTYAKLTGMMVAAMLVPGKWYQLQDYRLQTYNGDQSDVQVCYQTEQLLLQAATPTTLVPKGYSVSYPQDEVYYDPFSPLAQDYYGDSNYPQTHTGYIYRRVDTKWRNDFPFDFRNYLFYRYDRPQDQPTGLKTRAPLSDEVGGPGVSGYVMYEYYTYLGGHVTDNHWELPSKDTWPLEYVNFIMISGGNGGADLGGQLRNTRVEAGSKLFGEIYEHSIVVNLTVRNRGTVENLTVIYDGRVDGVLVDNGEIGDFTVSNSAVLTNVQILSGSYLIGSSIGGVNTQLKNLRFENGSGSYGAGDFSINDTQQQWVDNLVLDQNTNISNWAACSMIRIVASPGELVSVPGTPGTEATDDTPATDGTPDTSYMKYVELSPWRGKQLFYFGGKLIAGTEPVDPNAPTV